MEKASARPTTPSNSSSDSHDMVVPLMTASNIWRFSRRMKALSAYTLVVATRHEELEPALGTRSHKRRSEPQEPKENWGATHLKRAHVIRIREDRRRDVRRCPTCRQPMASIGGMFEHNRQARQCAAHV